MRTLSPWLPVLMLLSACASAPEPTGAPDEVVLWSIDSVDSIAGRPTRVLGAPRVVEESEGVAVEFDGVDDGLQVAVHPLEGAGEFTVEVVLRPYADGPREQRFLHLQEDASDDRVLFETRMQSASHWILDTHIESQGDGVTLAARRLQHPVGPWYHVALVVDGTEMRSYVNGEHELSRPIAYAPQGPGRTSIGVRINEVSWFRGAIRAARFTRRALVPGQFADEHGRPVTAGPEAIPAE